MSLSFCRITKNKIPIIANFGKMPISNSFLNYKKSLNNKYRFKMQAAFNEELGLFQLTKIPNPKKMFHKNYAFLSSTSTNMSKHFEILATKIKKKLKKDSRVCEIGCNDGIFLKNFKELSHLGFEPSHNVAKIAEKKGLNIIKDFFNFQNIKKNKLLSYFDIIFGANVICHIPKIIELLKNIKLSLRGNGRFIFEEPYLGAMVEKTSYDQIYDEHVYIFSAFSIKKLAEIAGLKLFDAEKLETHGGSMRYYLSKNTKKKETVRLKEIFLYEKNKKINKLNTLLNFEKKCLDSKKRIRKIIKKLKKKNILIYGYGATSKSTTILNYCRLNNNDLAGIFDTSPTKINKYTPGTNIKIINYNKFKTIKPKVCFLFAWNHFREIFNNEKNEKIKWICHIDKKFFPKKYYNKFI
jgi:methylation protein EvaC